MALLLCKTRPGTTRDVHLQYTSVLDYIFLLVYSEIYSYICFPMQIIEITRALTLLFILLHLTAYTTLRLEGFSLLLLAELSLVS